MTRVLVVEDEESFSDALSYMLRKEGFEGRRGGNGLEALEVFDRAGADLVLLDVMLPGVPGTEVCRRLRAKSSVPIIMLTAKDAEIDKVVGLELGADDYVTKPFGARELVARIRAVLRRGWEEEELLPSAVEAGPVRMDVERHVVSVRGEAVSLPLKEFDLLELLLRDTGGCSPAGRSSTGCGAPTTSATPRRSTSTSSACGPSSRTTRPTPATSSPSAAWATSSTPDPSRTGSGAGAPRRATLPPY